MYTSFFGLGWQIAGSEGAQSALAAKSSAPKRFACYMLHLLLHALLPAIKPWRGYFPNMLSVLLWNMRQQPGTQCRCIESGGKMANMPPWLARCQPGLLRPAEAPAAAGDRGAAAGCPACTLWTAAAPTCRARRTCSPTATTSAASSTTRRACLHACPGCTIEFYPCSLCLLVEPAAAPGRRVPQWLSLGPHPHNHARLLVLAQAGHNKWQLALAIHAAG